jgi:hypothetical protein
VAHSEDTIAWTQAKHRGRSSGAAVIQTQQRRSPARRVIASRAWAWQRRPQQHGIPKGNRKADSAARAGDEQGASRKRHDAVLAGNRYPQGRFHGCFDMRLAAVLLALLASQGAAQRTVNVTCNGGFKGAGQAVCAADRHSRRCDLTPFTRVCCVQGSRAATSLRR